MKDSNKTQIISFLLNALKYYIKGKASSIYEAENAAKLCKYYLEHNDTQEVIEYARKI